MRDDLEVDYLVIGTGAAGMAFTDALLTHSDATVALVDRRHAPGGHWIDAYPFVRLHQPSALYGVDSVPLGKDAIDSTGTNAGFYELAGPDELRAYYAHVLDRRFLPTGRVHYFPCCDYAGNDAAGHRFVSRLSGASHHVRVRRKLVDTTYLEGSIPATSPPPFAVADGVRCVPPGELARLGGPGERFVIVGGGKTALDTCVWLLEKGVLPAAIRWVKPREGWWMNRRFQQTRALLPDMAHGIAVQMEAMAEAATIGELLARLESEGVTLRIDRAVAPTMFRGGVLSEAELELLRRIEGVVRMGHVRRIEKGEIVLDEGTVPTDERTIHVHCSARGLASPPRRPIFEPGRVTVQLFMWGYACYQFAVLGVLEATVDGDESKNALCPAISLWSHDEDYLAAFLALLAFTSRIPAHPRLASWSKASRLNAMSGLAAHRDDPRTIASRERVKRYGVPAAANLRRLLSQRT